MDWLEVAVTALYTTHDHQGCNVTPICRATVLFSPRTHKCSGDFRLHDTVVLLRPVVSESSCS